MHHVKDAFVFVRGIFNARVHVLLCNMHAVTALENARTRVVKCARGFWMHVFVKTCEILNPPSFSQSEKA